MPQVPKDLDAYASPRAYFGAELRRVRTDQRYSQRQLADALIWSAAMVRSVETAERMPSEQMSTKLDEVLGVDTFHRLWRLVDRDRYSKWFRDIAKLEPQATGVQLWHTHLVPGLLQTPEYARCAIRAARPDISDDELDQIVSGRLARQTALTREHPPLVWVIIDEAVIRRAVGGPAAFRDQLAHLLAMAELPNITLQVLSFTAEEHPGMDGPLMVFGFDDRLPSIAYLEASDGGRTEENPTTVARYMARYDRLRAVALTPMQSTAYLAEEIERLDRWLRTTGARAATPPQTAETA